MTRRLLTTGTAITLALAACGGSNASADSGSPQSCLDALDRADELLAMTGEALTLVGDAFEAAERLDMAELSRAEAELSDISDGLDPVLESYATERDACRAG